MDRSVDERNAGWRAESDRNAWNRERDDWQSSGNWRNRPGSEANRSAPGAPEAGPPNAFRGGWGNTGGFSESFYNRGISPNEPGVGGLEALESHWPAAQQRRANAPPNADWPNSAPRSAASAAAEAERDWARDERAWSRPRGWAGSAPPSNWSAQHAGIAEPVWGGSAYANRRDRDWGDAGSSWSRGAGAREWGSQPDWDLRGRSAEGPYRGRGPHGYQRSDERIREDVCDLLTERGDIDASEIDVRVSSREVTLDGSVPDRRMKRLAEDIAESTLGVRDVHNRLRVDSDRGDARAWNEHAWSADERGSSDRSSSRGANAASRRASAARGANASSRGASASRGANASSRDANASSRGANASSRGANASSRGANASSRGANASSRGANASARGANASSRAASSSRAAGRGSSNPQARSSRSAANRSASNAAGRSGNRSGNAPNARDRDPNAPGRSGRGGRSR